MAQLLGAVGHRKPRRLPDSRLKEELGAPRRPGRGAAPQPTRILERRSRANLSPSIESSHRDGSYHWAFVRGVLFRDAQGRPIRSSGSVIDINDLKQAEEKLRESEERFRGTFENAAVGIAHMDSQNRCLRATRS